MKISQFKSALQLAKPAASPVFLQTSGLSIAAHYHITEIGLEELEVEFQGQTIETYGLLAQDFGFQFTSKKTTCLAPGHCGIPNELLPQEMQVKTSCSPGSGCC
jgi:hypothetical protein